MGTGRSQLWGDELRFETWGEPRARRTASAVDALDYAGRDDDAMLLVEEGAARLRDFGGWRGRGCLVLGTMRGYADPAVGLPLIDEALTAYRDLPPTLGHVDLLREVVANRHTQGLRSRSHPC